MIAHDHGIGRVWRTSMDLSSKARDILTRNESLSGGHIVLTYSQSFSARL